MKLTNEEKCVYCREYGNLPCDECNKKLEEKKAMNKTKYFIDLSKCSDEQRKHIFSLLPEPRDYWLFSISYKCSSLAYVQNENHGFEWVVCVNIAMDGRTELTYPEFIKLFDEERTELSFETEYHLEEFRRIQSEYFDENGKCYSGIRLSENIMEQMLSLINQLETELKSKQ